MSVLIRGMKMPESCFTCVAGYGGFCSVAPPESDGVCPPRCERPDWCPLVELPLKHGRLVDADSLISQVEDLIKLNENTVDQYEINMLQDSIELIKKQPVLVDKEDEWGEDNA